MNIIDNIITIALLCILTHAPGNLRGVLSVAYLWGFDQRYIVCISCFLRNIRFSWLISKKEYRNGFMLPEE